jgi:hypothetical protein
MVVEQAGVALSGIQRPDDANHGCSVNKMSITK